ncbi:MAG: hypothetical protein SGPRY_005998 [Prymnesium sp.]
MEEYWLCSLLLLYVSTTLTIPLWVPIVKHLTGNTGLFWVFSTLTYYAYLAWLVFAALILFFLVHWPTLGALWLLLFIARVINFTRLRARSPSDLSRVSQQERANKARADDGVAEMGSAGIGKGGVCSMGRVLLVGNGPSMKERGMGSVVDSFDTVVRFNSFVTDGMEEHTGSKASILPAPVPTTGFVMLMRLLETVDCVHLVGFDGFSIGKELHYYQEQRMQLQVNAAGALLHDWVAEQRGIQRLIDEGRVVLL